MKFRKTPEMLPINIQMSINYVTRDGEAIQINAFYDKDGWRHWGALREELEANKQFMNALEETTRKYLR